MMSLSEQFAYGLLRASDDRLRSFLEGRPLALYIYPDSMDAETFELLRQELRTRSFYVDPALLRVDTNHLQGLKIVMPPALRARI